MKKYKYEFEVDDDFEKGCCFDCPLQESEWYECNISEASDDSKKCPLVEVK